MQAGAYSGEHPLPVIPYPGAPVPRLRKHRYPENLHTPTRERRRERFTTHSLGLREAFEKQQARHQARATGVAPEEVVMFQTVESVEDSGANDWRNGTACGNACPKPVVVDWGPERFYVLRCPEALRQTR